MAGGKPEVSSTQDSSAHGWCIQEYLTDMIVLNFLKHEKGESAGKQGRVSYEKNKEKKERE